MKDKVIVVTGASRGIGRATAKILAENGGRVIVNYNGSETRARELVDELHTAGYEADMFKADVSKEEEVKALYDFVREKYGRIDVLINNAGIMKNNLVMMTKAEEFDQLIDINCRGIFLCTRAFSKMMTRQKSGKIINTASIVGVYGNSGQTLYSASKSFVIGYTKAAAKELGNFGITVNAVAPGFIESDMTVNTTEKVRNELMSKIALGRFGKPEDIAKVMLFLSSELSDYISGQTIGVDGCEIM
ncbi:MAG: 3-oxoacyl-ACP reductase FabG [Bacteroidales bacterium]|nr:3-oxoacyl-ACP reductase FabG [Bacteroidales bacterium]